MTGLLKLHAFCTRDPGRGYPSRLEHCPPGCSLFNTALRLCLGGGALRCEACLQAESDTKKKENQEHGEIY